MLQKPKPGWDIVLAPEKAPKDISSNIDAANILRTKRRANLAIVHDVTQLDEDFDNIGEGPVAMASGECVKWREATDLELGAMANLDLWEIVYIPRDHRLLGTIWVFRKKTSSDVSRVNDRALFLSQEVYTSKILADHNMSEMRHVATPMIPNSQLFKATVEEHNKSQKINCKSETKH
ncbi:uncharacterized protein VP01_4573g1 [Puccinia sorghi]|uniref:Reverse transcriptase Ty1/copia-type domain-containing protein n=1 Tax=Puccinia sorghi TaxID=27349 RepID=A0A0L6UNP7_9BASI|nr:uncharacterized protein VP01_4573g1 [Puccinia sorghi]